jgi:hypothetical protein
MSISANETVIYNILTKLLCQVLLSRIVFHVGHAVFRGIKVKEGQSPHMIVTAYIS